MSGVVSFYTAFFKFCYVFFGFSVVMFPVFGATLYSIFVPCNTLIFSFHSIVYGLVFFVAFTTK